MPLFKRGQKKPEVLTDSEQQQDATNNHSAPEMPTTPPGSQPRPSPADPLPGATAGKKTQVQHPAKPQQQQQQQQQQLVFLCQLAHGSPTGRIAGFTNVRQLYEKIADAFDMPAAEILFCTLNVYKVDMSRLLGGQIGLEDFIYAHIKGEVKKIEVVKSEPSLGLTITDNGAGYAFVKRIKEDSIMAKMDECLVGDHIESINGKSMIGARHFEVARAFKELPVGLTFTMVLVEPRKAFTKIQPRGPRAAPASPLVTPGNPVNEAASKKIGTGKETLRLRSKGPAEIAPLPTEFEAKAAGKVDDLLESYMGIRDLELANELVELFKGKTDFPTFTSGVTEALGEFDFPETFVFDVWGAISDAKSGRI